MNLTTPNKLARALSLCPYYRLIWGRYKSAKERKVNHVFYLGCVVSITSSKNGSLIKLFRVSDIPHFSSVSNLEEKSCKYDNWPINTRKIFHIFVLKPSLKFSREYFLSFSRRQRSSSL